MNLRLTWSIQCVPGQPTATMVRPCLRKQKQINKKNPIKQNSRYFLAWHSSPFHGYPPGFTLSQRIPCFNCLLVLSRHDLVSLYSGKYLGNTISYHLCFYSEGTGQLEKVWNRGHVTMSTFPKDQSWNLEKSGILGCGVKKMIDSSVFAWRC